MASTAFSSTYFPQILQRRNVSPDVPEDIDDSFDEHFNDPNWDYSTPSPSSDTTTFVEKRSSWTNSSVRTSDIETSSQYGSTSGPSKMDLREAALQNEYVIQYYYTQPTQLTSPTGIRHTQKLGQPFRITMTRRCRLTLSERACTSSICNVPSSWPSAVGFWVSLSPSFLPD